MVWYSSLAEWYTSNENIIVPGAKFFGTVGAFITAAALAFAAIHQART